MTRDSLVSQIRDKKSFLCVGLDSDLQRMPDCLSGEKDPVLKFNQEIVAATQDLCVAYKPNVAFYESRGAEGWKTLEETMKHIPDEIFTIADAKRGDIGNTSKMYAQAFFKNMEFDSVTVAPYMGVDSVAPFLEFNDKWVILLGLTSNKGSSDFQMLETGGSKLYEEVITRSQAWGSPDNLMYVIGATHPDKLAQVRALAQEFFFLVPGVGAQGGTVADVAGSGMNDEVGLLVNSSRGILYASDGPDFAEAAREAALNLKNKMEEFIV